MWIVPYFEKKLYDNPNTIVVVKDEDYKKELIPYLSGYGLKIIKQSIIFSKIVVVHNHLMI
ncbi:hypothetical protein [Clostridium sp. CCUG 7971]|uniref:hypothetical protein n=1 Tax=Clostridium sp. CCUG 7971 TaxID=2811414 RepID=UPI001ABB7E1D|nr:hypothetical protein [Clostridium sp. CCUG 7971]MBO3445645.1 hypothetical protein [Clostridium sp. CCUG 7971]